MVRRRLLIVSVAVLAGLAAGYWHVAGLIDWRGIGDNAPASIERASREDAASIAAPPAAAPSAGGDAASAVETPDVPPAQAAADETPVIDLLRVEPDGGTVLAGRAAPGSNVSVLSQGSEIARETASASGEFAIVLADPLAVGAHELRLRTEGIDGTLRQSDETAVVNVPPAGRESDLLVMLQSPDRPAQVIERPGVPAAPVDVAGEPAQAPDAGAVSPNAAGDEPAQTAAIAPTTEPAPATVPQSAPSLGIGAIEIEGDRLFVAGAAAPNATVRLYIDDAFVGQTTGRPQGDFYTSVPATVAIGEHVVRADVVGADGLVVARVEVPFDRPNEGAMSAVATVPAAPASTSAQGAPSSVPSVVTQAEPSPAPAFAGTAPSSPPASAASAPGPVVGGESRPAVAGAAEPAASTPSSAALESTADPISAAEITAVQQAALQPVEGRVLIRRGDTLWRISRETYGRGARYTVIYLANGDQIRNPDLIYPGQIFRMPEGSATN